MPKEQKRILIVDDNHAIHEDLRQVLTPKTSIAFDQETVALEDDLFADTNEQKKDNHHIDQSYIIDDAFQGLEAIDMVSKAEIEGNPYSLIFMDVRMPPGLDGIQTIQRIWKKYHHIEIVICTAHSDYSWDQIVQELGQTDKLLFMKKPFDSVSVRQTAFALTRRWDVDNEKQKNLEALEVEVEKRTKQLNSLIRHLEDLKTKAELRTIAKNGSIINMSHEVRTPLNGILGTTDLLLDTDLTEEQRGCAEKIKSTSDSFLIAINDILNYSKMEAGNIELEEVDFSLRNAVDNVTDLVSVNAQEKGLRIATLIQSDIPDILFGDPLRIRQVLLNFITNAVKFTEAGEISISISQDSAQSVNELKKGKEASIVLRFEVSDTGIGLAQEKQKTIFKTFTEDEISTKKNKSTGLGLSISKQLVKLMKGDIGVDSKEGKGSIFWFTAKLKTGEMDSLQLSDSFGSIKGMRCLIVGDSPISRKVLALHINKWGGNCSESSTIESTIEKLQTSLTTKPFDVVILDFQEGDLDFYKDIAHAIKRHKNLCDVNLICLIVNLKKGDINAFKEVGFKGFLIKPIKQSQLYNCILMLKWINGGQLDLKGIDMITNHLADIIASDCYRILVVDDDKINQKIVVSLLNKVKIRCDVASNGKEALDAHSSNKYDMILMDCQMPVMDGFEATQAIRENENIGEHIPIIAITAAASAKNMKKSLAAGMDDFISKPFKLEDMSETLRKHLKSK